jgi:hypothetical protein
MKKLQFRYFHGETPSEFSSALEIHGRIFIEVKIQPTIVPSTTRSQ